jgi:hypothetical protein
MMENCFKQDFAQHESGLKTATSSFYVWELRLVLKFFLFLKPLSLEKKRKSFQRR